MSEKPKSIVEQVKAELVKAKRDSAKKKIKDLMIELEKAEDVRRGIISQIEQVLVDLGDAADLEEVLSS